MKACTSALKYFQGSFQALNDDRVADIGICCSEHTSSWWPMDLFFLLCIVQRNLNINSAVCTNYPLSFAMTQNCRFPSHIHLISWLNAKTYSWEPPQVKQFELHLKLTGSKAYACSPSNLGSVPPSQHCCSVSFHSSWMGYMCVSLHYYHFYLR